MVGFMTGGATGGKGVYWVIGCYFVIIAGGVILVPRSWA